MERSVWIGYDPREAHAFAACRHSINKRLTIPIPVRGLIMSDLIDYGLYTRETIRQDGLLFDVISDHPMATEFAISRFLVPYMVRHFNGGTLYKQNRWAVFMDCDVICRTNIDRLFALGDPSKAVQVVKHNFNPPEGTKMDGQVQSRYAKKNWSSVMLFNVDHPANDALTPELVNSVPGRDLHGFCWLKDDDIGELPVEWNYLVGHHSKRDCKVPMLIHYTDGIPTMSGYEDCEYADEWRSALADFAR